MFTRLATLACAAALLSACATTGSSSGGPSTATQASYLSVADPWVKAAESGMTAAFGTLTNDGADDATVVSAASDVAGEVQLHETVIDSSGQGTMREKDGGFLVPAGGTFDLEPGGDHVMLMDLKAPLEAGDQVTFTLAFADGSTLDVTAPVKDYAGANESYDDMGGDEPGDGTDGTGMDGMDMGGDSH
ncbi:copper chaperone PCu(A)C [Xylanimonas allomyrinae]|uniref:Copper chaperone PCu(A)C n=1 Tax=Xylanimonas allomyrinae TaxID=2509459 RepID=A0A4V0YEM9_9MICO|nr:copper chaperone PCu(A)C [Xylanimonas allomyrinae]